VDIFNLLYVIIRAKNELEIIGHTDLAKAVQDATEGKATLDELFANFLITLKINECEKHTKRTSRKKNRDRNNNTKSENNSNTKRCKPHTRATKRKFSEWAKAV
jgi:hypothetical protein